MRVKDSVSSKGLATVVGNIIHIAVAIRPLGFSAYLDIFIMD